MCITTTTTTTGGGVGGDDDDDYYYYYVNCLLLLDIIPLPKKGDLCCGLSTISETFLTTETKILLNNILIRTGIICSYHLAVIKDSHRFL
jgi:hypothetical protein